jgi:hypothetical protein
MSVLKLRRDMVVVEDDPETQTVSESDKPFPLRKFDHEHDQSEDLIEGRIEEEADDEEEAEEAAPRRKTVFQHIKFWFNASAIVALLAAYPAFTIASSDVGDRNFETLVSRADWAAPWAGSSASLLEQHFDQLGWAPDAAAWEPMARLTAKPAYQEAMAGSLGDVIKLANAQSAAKGTPDVDLGAAARLVNQDATGIQLRAARDALVNFDRRLRRRDEVTDFTPAQISEQLQLISAWAMASQQQVNASSSSIGGSPMDEDATRAVYAAKGRAIVAYMVLGSMQWPESIAAAKARDAAMSAWRDVAKFHPLVVLNGDPDGSVFGNHAIAIGFQVARAQQATDAFAALVAAPAP